MGKRLLQMPCSPKFMREFKIECLIFQKYGRILFVTNDDWRIVGYILSLLVECSLIGDKLMVSGVVIDLNLKEGYSTCLSPLGFLDAVQIYTKSIKIPNI